MAHINPRLDPRRAKMLDQGNKSVKGGNQGKRRAQRVAKQNYHQWVRRCEDRTYRHLRDFRCSGDAECDCPGCSSEPGPSTRIPEDRWNHFETAPSLDDLGGAFRSAKKWALRLGSSDALFSWLKENYPDTLAGRHAIDHIMEGLTGWWGLVQCKCNVDFGGKGNHGQCTCKAFLPKNRHLSGQHRRNRRRRGGRRLGSR